MTLKRDIAMLFTLSKSWHIYKSHPGFSECAFVDTISKLRKELVIYLFTINI